MVGDIISYERDTFEEEDNKISFEELKREILLRIGATGGFSFVEMMRIEGCEGHQQFFMPKNNIVLWTGLSEDCIKALQELISEKRIEMHPTQMLIYLADGRCINPPIAKKNIKYKKPRWLPVCFDIIKENNKDIDWDVERKRINDKEFEKFSNKGKPEVKT